MTIRVTSEGVHEDLTSQIDGQQTTFTTTYKYISGTLRVRLNGVEQGPLPGSCAEVTETTFIFIPYVLRPPDTLFVVYSPKPV
ncbi:MAG: hypothetical protein GYA36_19780 [Veillonellaceae bacterium]|nr:hypothetical protein [Veillonellaceae bacterium]